MAEDRNTPEGGTAGTGEAENVPERRADSPARGQGDDFADELGGGEGGGAGLADAGAATGDERSARSESGSGDGLGGIHAGSPGGMGGVRAAGGTGTGRPPGGVSPVEGDGGRDDDSSAR
jgi:hypothetical protein